MVRVFSVVAGLGVGLAEWQRLLERQHNNFRLRLGYVGLALHDRQRTKLMLVTTLVRELLTRFS